MKRFIAGAVCPACGLEDKIYIISEDNLDIRRCSSCGFSDQRPGPEEPDSGEWNPVKIQDS